MAGAKPATNLRPGPEKSETWKRRDLSAAPAMPMAMATMAAVVQMASHAPALCCRAANRAAPNATAPISTPPMPGTAVNDPARSSVCRMYFRLSMACSCSSTVWVRGVAINLNDSVEAAAFQVLFVIKAKGASLWRLTAVKMRETSVYLDDPDKMLA